MTVRAHYFRDRGLSTWRSQTLANEVYRRLDLAIVALK